MRSIFGIVPVPFLMFYYLRVSRLAHVNSYSFIVLVNEHKLFKKITNSIFTGVGRGRLMQRMPSDVSTPPLIAILTQMKRANDDRRSRTLASGLDVWAWKRMTSVYSGLVSRGYPFHADRSYSARACLMEIYSAGLGRRIGIAGGTVRLRRTVCAGEVRSEGI